MTKLKSIKEMQGYELGGQDGKIGRCSDFLFDDRTWAIRYIVGDTQKWLPGSKRVIISPEWVDRVEWGDGSILVSVPKDS